MKNCWYSILVLLRTTAEPDLAEFFWAGHGWSYIRSLLIIHMLIPFGNEDPGVKKMLLDKEATKRDLEGIPCFLLVKYII